MSKEIEREVRYLINEEIENNIINNCVVEKEKYHTIDIVVGYDGFNSLNKYGYIIRIRNKGEKKYIESKKRLSDGSWSEARISINDMKEALNFLINIGYKPYLIIERERTELKYHDLKIFVDNVNLLGKFVEIEYQDSNLDEVKKFIDMVKIVNNPQKLYGDIFQEKVEEKEFNQEFQDLVRKYI